MPSDGNLILYRRAGSSLPRRDIRVFADKLRDQVTGGRPFTCMITDDSELERLNRMFLGKDYPTDVLSFPSTGPGPLGEIAISVQRAAEQAGKYGHEVLDEVRILMLHGVLHLLGMDHEGDHGSMARAERRWRQIFHLPDGLIERTRSKKAK
jgi:probable rRNA maturation factor